MNDNQPLQIRDVIGEIKKLVARDRFRFSKHAIERQVQRSIHPHDALYVLTNGVHEKKKTSFDPVFHTWKYAVRGKTEDGVDIRVIVALVSEMIIITVIRLTKKKYRRKL